MKAIRVAKFGGVEGLSLDEIPEPVPGEGEVLVKIEYAGINFIDVYMRNGLYARSHTYGEKPPMTIGMEGAGTVAVLGDKADGTGVASLAPGDRVAWCIHPASYAEYAVVPAWKLVKVPDDVPLDIACALQLQGSTAHYLTHALFPLRYGMSCLVHAGAGGVGQLLIQLAKARGATVYATVGSPEKAAIAKARGADDVILYREENFREKIRYVTGGVGVDVVYDSVGKDTIMDSIGSLKRRGTVCSYGASSGAVTSIDPLDLAEAGSVFFTRPHLADYIATPEERTERARDLFAAFRDGNLVVTLDRTFPLADAADAHRAIEGRQTKGKLLLETPS